MVFTAFVIIFMVYLVIWLLWYDVIWMNKKKKKEMAGAKSSEEQDAERIIYEINQSLSEDDEVFLANTEIYSDMGPKKAGNAGRIRRASDVIDSLGEEVYRGHSMPISPQRASLDLGYSGSVASSPSPFFTFPQRSTVTDNDPCMTDSNPVIGTYDNSSNSGIVARMPVDRDEEMYNMSHQHRGLAVILNNEIFNDRLDHRTGSSVDVSRLTEAYKTIGFQVVVHHNLCLNDMLAVLANVAAEDHTNNDCLIVTVMTHGIASGYLHSRDHLYSTQELWTPFTADKCPTLAGKPKLFFIQACRGTQLDSGVTLTSRPINCSETDSSCSSYKIPCHSDLLISFSSMDGHYSWRNTVDGTWFIQSLAHELEIGYRNQKQLMSIMTSVHRRVAMYYESEVPYTPDLTNKRQAPIFHSSLLRDLIFTPKN